MFSKSTVYVFLIVRTCHAMLGGSLATTTIPNNVDTLHQIIQTESLIRMEMQKQMANLESTISDLRNNLQSLHSELTDMKNQHGIEIDSLKASYANCQNTTIGTMTSMFEQKQPSITFLVGLQTNLIDAPTTTVIKFDKYITNIGNAYNSQTGIFTVPVSGTYQLSLTLISETSSARGNIRVNGNTLVHIFADNTQYVTGWGRASTSLATHLNAGDQVYVTEPDGGHQTIVGMTGNTPVSLFSGHLIQAD